MRAKLSLKLDDLMVDSFDTTAAQKAKGTVFGEQCTCWTNCTCPGCPTCNTCGDTCNTCGATCPATCYNTCDDATCNTCGDTCNYSCECNSYQPCPSAQYTYCNGIECY